MTPQCLVAWIRLNEVSAELHLLVEELRNGTCVGIVHCPPCAVSIRLMNLVGLWGMGREVLTACLKPLQRLTQLSQQSLEKELAVVEATVVRNVHGHPEPRGGQLVMKNLQQQGRSTLMIHSINSEWHQDL